LLGDHRQALDLLLHLLKGDRLIRHDGAIEAAGILLRKKPLGYFDVQKHRQTDRCDGDDECDQRAVEHPGQALLVALEQRPLRW
jgi:hypothetical protein